MRGVVAIPKELDVVHIQVNILRQSLDVEYNPAHVKIIGEFDTDKEKQ